MTLDVGYAEYRLPDDTEVGLIDVPGHEKLVRTMVAGATSMDLALLVIAADDGPMLQTREHVDILDLLGIRRAVVAVTKVDLVPDGPRRPGRGGDPRAARGHDARGRADAPRVLGHRRGHRGAEGRDRRRDPARSTTAARTLGRSACRSCAPSSRPAAARSSPGSPRPDGSRTATPWTCSRSAGRAACAASRCTTATRRRPASGHRDRAGARRRRRPTRSSAGWSSPPPGRWFPCPRFAARLRVLSRLGEPLRHGMGVRVHVGADQMAARLHLLEGDTLAPGAVTAVELTGRAPVPRRARRPLRAARREQRRRPTAAASSSSASPRACPRRREGIVAVDPRARRDPRRPRGADPRVR